MIIMKFICTFILPTFLLLNFHLDSTVSLSHLQWKHKSITFIKQCTLVSYICGSIVTSSTSPILAEIIPESIVIQKIQGSCVSGVGDACEDLAQGNVWIQELQRKSALTKDKTQKVTCFYNMVLFLISIYKFNF